MVSSYVWLSFALMWTAVVGETGIAPPGGHTIKLFDGVTFNGWTNAEGKAVTKNWSIKDEMLVLNGKGGSIFTADQYSDFDLSFQWKIAPHGNSGVKYRVAYYKKGLHGSRGWLGCEYQLYDDVNPKPTTKYSSGALYDIYAPIARRQLKPAGEFNDGRIVVRGNTIEHWLNGVRVVKAEIGSADWKKRISASKFTKIDQVFQNPAGKILLQDHRSKVWFRNIALTRLENQPRTLQSPTPPKPPGPRDEN